MTGRRRAFNPERPVRRRLAGRCRTPARGAALAAALAAVVAASPAAAQRPVTLAEALDAALAASPSVAVARADSGMARAELRTAREWPNPDLAADYTKDAPHYHVVLEQPFEYPWVRGPRIRGARAGAAAASLRLAVERARLRYDITRTYAEAAAGRQVATLAARQAEEGERLVRVTEQRRDAGDASDLDVDLARVNARQLQSSFLSDSLTALTATLELQSLMGLPVDSIRIIAVDTFDPATMPAAAAATPHRPPPHRPTPHRPPPHRPTPHRPTPRRTPPSPSPPPPRSARPHWAGSPRRDGGGCRRPRCGWAWRRARPTSRGCCPRSA